MKEIDEFYSARSCMEFNKGMKKTNIQVTLSNKIVGRCLIWVAGRSGGVLIYCIRENFPNIDIVGVIDTYKVVTYGDLDMISLYEIGKYHYEGIYISTIPVQQYTKQKLNEMALQENKDYWIILC